MPRQTTIKANKREAVDPRSIFRLTTPRMNVTARPLNTARITGYSNQTTEFVKSLQSTLTTTAGMIKEHNREAARQEKVKQQLLEKQRKAQAAKDKDQGELDAYMGNEASLDSDEYIKSYYTALAAKQGSAYKTALSQLNVEAEREGWTPDIYAEKRNAIQQEMLGLSDNPYYQGNFAKNAMGYDAEADAIYQTKFRDRMKKENFASLNQGMSDAVATMLSQGADNDTLVSVVDSYVENGKELGIDPDELKSSFMSNIVQHAIDARDESVLEVLEHKNKSGVSVAAIKGGSERLARAREAIEDAREADLREEQRIKTRFTEDYAAQLYESMNAADDIQGKDRVNAIQNMLYDLERNKSKLTGTYYRKTHTDLTELVKGGGFASITDVEVHDGLLDTISSYDGTNPQVLHDAYEQAKYSLTHSDAMAAYKSINRTIATHTKLQRTEEGRSTARRFRESMAALKTDIKTGFSSGLVDNNNIMDLRRHELTRWYNDALDNNEYPTKEDFEAKVASIRQQYPPDEMFIIPQKKPEPVKNLTQVRPKQTTPVAEVDTNSLGVDPLPSDEQLSEWEKQRREDALDTGENLF